MAAEGSREGERPSTKRRAWDNGGRQRDGPFVERGKWRYEGGWVEGNAWDSGVDDIRERGRRGEFLS